MPGRKPKKVVPTPSSGDYFTDGQGLWRFELYLPENEGVVVEDGRTGTTVSWRQKEWEETIASPTFRILDKAEIRAAT